MSSNTPADVKKLGDQVGGDNAAAIAEFIDGRIDAAFDKNRSELTELAERVRTMHAQHGATEEVKGAAKAVSDATTDHNDAVDRTQYADDTDATSAAKADTERVEQARQAVDEAERSLEGRVSDLERDVAELKRSRTRQRADIDQLKTGQTELRSVSSSAFASATAGGRGFYASPIEFGAIGAGIGAVGYVIVIAIHAIGDGSWGDFSWLALLLFTLLGAGIGVGIALLLNMLASAATPARTTATAHAETITGRWAEEARASASASSGSQPQQPAQPPMIGGFEGATAHAGAESSGRGHAASGASASSHH